MNRIILVTTAGLLAATATFAGAQTPTSAGVSEQTLLPSGIAGGGYGAPVQRFSTVTGTSVLFSGVEGGWIVNHRFVLGAAAYGLATQNIRRMASSWSTLRRMAS